MHTVTCAGRLTIWKIGERQTVALHVGAAREDDDLHIDGSIAAFG